MTTQYVGFQGDQLGQIQRVNVTTANALQHALNTSFNQSDTFLRALEKYFGKASRNQSAVMAVLNSMILTVRQGTYDLQMVGADANTLAQAYTRGNAKGGYKEEVVEDSKIYHKPYVATAQDASPGSATNARLNIEIMPSFFTLPFRGKDEQTQVECLVHELSHHAANTNDEKVLGMTCYGLAGVRAAKLAHKAANNAENYGFFVASLQNYA